MLYLGIDQHARQVTISLRDENGDVLQARQVSTRPEKIHDFFAKLTRECLQCGESFLAVLEICGFNDWLLRLLADYRCHKTILIQPEERSRQKTEGVISYDCRKFLYVSSFQRISNSVRLAAFSVFYGF